MATYGDGDDDGDDVDLNDVAVDDEVDDDVDDDDDDDDVDDGVDDDIDDDVVDDDDNFFGGKHSLAFQPLGELARGLNAPPGNGFCSTFSGFLGVVGLASPQISTSVCG